MKKRNVVIVVLIIIFSLIIIGFSINLISSPINTFANQGEEDGTLTE